MRSWSKCTLRIAGASPFMIRLFQIGLLDALVRFHDSVNDAEADMTVSGGSPRTFVMNSQSLLHPLSTKAMIRVRLPNACGLKR